MPGAVQPQWLIELQKAAAHGHARRMHRASFRAVMPVDGLCITNWSTRPPCSLLLGGQHTSNLNELGCGAGMGCCKRTLCCGRT